MFEITNVVYLYFFIVVLLIIFNVAYVYNERIQDKIGKKRKQKYREILMEESSNEEFTPKKKKYFYRQLKSVNRLLWFQSTIEELREEDEIDVSSIIQKLNDVFQKLAVHYQSKDSIQKAYFAHVLSTYPNLSDNKSDRIYQTMMKFVTDGSIYCRENAMIYFYNNGSVENVIRSLKSINLRGQFYSSKVLSDDLLKFHGDKAELGQRLLDNFDEFNVEMQIGIINFLRLLDEDFKEKVYTLYVSHKYDKEVELCIIRYFAKHKYFKILDELVTIMNDARLDNDDLVEYRIVGTNVLSAYDDKKTRELLIDALSDSNWYVRKNAASALVNMQLSDEELNKIMKSEDRYAKEIISYVFEDAENKKMEGSK